MLVNRILLASHGTEGAIAAERVAMSMCGKGGKIHHLIVVPALWHGMTGDDWLNNGSTRDTFRRYLENELGREIDEHCERVSNKASINSLVYSNEIVLGEPENMLVNVSEKESFDVIVMGSPRPKAKKGLRSRMLTEGLVRSVTTPLLIVPYPQNP